MSNNTNNTQNFTIQLNNSNNNVISVNTDVKTASSELDYPNLFRGLSTFELEPTPSMIEKLDVKAPNNEINKAVNSEKSFDLSDLLLQHQSSINQFDNRGKSLAQLNPVQFDKADNLSYNSNMTVNNYDKENQNRVMAPSDALNDSMNEDTSNSPLSEQTSNSARVARKRLSDASSNVSSLEAVPKKRGRRPINEARNAKPTKKQLLIEQSNGKLVCFGNKVVEKDTDEYEKRRRNNNDAVKKCREKLAQEQKQKEEKMKSLDDENKRLTGIVLSLKKELDVLKNIIISMSPQNKLPDHLEKLIKNIDEI